MMSRLVQTIRVFDQQGVIVEILEIEEQLETGTGFVVSGMQTLMLSNGSPVTDLGDGRFEVVNTGRLLSTIGPTV